MKLPYAEGTLFAVPLRSSGFAAGIVARASKRGRVILCYFFGPMRKSIPSTEELVGLEATSALCAIIVGDLGLINGKWQIIGSAKGWDRANWPMPVFVRRDPITHKAWRVYYSDVDPNKCLKEEGATDVPAMLETDSLYGYGAAEIRLTKMLSSPQSKWQR